MSLNKPTSIGFDEIALRKGHDHYLTIVTDLTNFSQTKIIAFIDGRTRDDLLPFLRKIPKQILLSLNSICVDIGASYLLSLKEIINNDILFNEIVTIDRFHVAKLVGEKVDKERKKFIAKLKNEHKDNPVYLEQIKDTMWPFRHPPKDLNEEQETKLSQLFLLNDDLVDKQNSTQINSCDASVDLKETYILREQLYNIFEKLLTKKNAKKTIEKRVTKACSFHALDTFIKTYKKFDDNIINYFKYRGTSGPVEGMNNKIKVIKRRGYGFTNVHNFTKRLFSDINLKYDYLPS